MLNRGGRVLLWRWRRNPLRRRSDVAETWIGLAAALVLMLTAPAMGVAAAGIAESSALAQAHGLHRVTAVLVQDATAAATLSDGVNDDHGRATVRWTTSSGSTRSGLASVPTGSKAGSHTTVWLDAAGRIHPEPATAAQATAQGVVFGTAAAVGTSVLVLGMFWVAGVRLDRRRLAQWEQAWAEFDVPRGHRHA